jgi:hypothetical protein
MNADLLGMAPLHQPSMKKGSKHIQFPAQAHNSEMNFYKGSSAQQQNKQGGNPEQVNLPNMPGQGN